MSIFIDKIYALNGNSSCTESVIQWATFCRYYVLRKLFTELLFVTWRRRIGYFYFSSAFIHDVSGIFEITTVLHIFLTKQKSSKQEHSYQRYFNNVCFMCLLLRYKIINFAPIPKITCYLPNPKYMVYEHKILGQKLVFHKDFLYLSTVRYCHHNMHIFIANDSSIERVVTFHCYSTLSSSLDSHQLRDPRTPIFRQFQQFENPMNELF